MQTSKRLLRARLFLQRTSPGRRSERNVPWPRPLSRKEQDRAARRAWNDQPVCVRGGRGPLLEASLAGGAAGGWARARDLDHSPDEPSERLQEPHDPLLSAAVHVTSDGHAAAHERGAEVVLKGVHGDGLPLRPEGARTSREGAAEAVRAAAGAARSGASLCGQEGR